MQIIKNKYWGIKVIAACLLIIGSFQYMAATDRNTNPNIAYCFLQPERFKDATVYVGKIDVVEVDEKKFIILAGERKVEVRGSTTGLQKADLVTFVGTFKGDHVELVRVKKIFPIPYARAIMNLVSTAVMIFVLLLLLRYFKINLPKVIRG